MSSLPLATDWATVGFTFLGVIVGGLITLLGTWLTLRESKVTERASEARERQATIWMLLASLDELRGFLNRLKDDRVWQAAGDTDWVARWQDRAVTLAGHGSSADFERIARAFLVARLVTWQADQEGQDFVGTRDDLLIANWLKAVTAGTETLKRMRADADSS